MSLNDNCSMILNVKCCNSVNTRLFIETQVFNNACAHIIKCDRPLSRLSWPFYDTHLS